MGDAKNDKQKNEGDNGGGGGGGSVTVHYVPIDEIADEIRGIIEDVDLQKSNPNVASDIEAFRTMLDKIVIVIKLFGALGGIFFYVTGALVSFTGGIGATIMIIFSAIFCLLTMGWSGAKVANALQPLPPIKGLIMGALIPLKTGTFQTTTPPTEKLKAVLGSHLNNCNKTKYFVEMIAQFFLSLTGLVVSIIQLVMGTGPYPGFLGIPFSVILPLSIFGIFLTIFHAGGLIVWVIVTLGLIFGKVVGKILNALRCNFNDTCDNEVQDVHVYGVEQQKATSEIKKEQQSADVQVVSKKDILAVKPLTGKEKKLIIKCYKNKGEETELGKLMEEIVVNPEDHKTNGEIDNAKYGAALKKAREKITSVIAECKSGIYKDINKLIGLNYGKLDELEQKTANAQDEYAKKINARVNFAMRELEDKATKKGKIDEGILKNLVVDKKIVKAWKNRKERSKIVKGSLAAASGIPSAFKRTKNKLTNVDKTRKAYKLYDAEEEEEELIKNKTTRVGRAYRRAKTGLRKGVRAVGRRIPFTKFDNNEKDYNEIENNEIINKYNDKKVKREAIRKERAEKAEEAAKAAKPS